MMNLQCSDKGFSDSGPHSQKMIHRSHDILLHEGALLSVILLGKGGKEKT